MRTYNSFVRDFVNLADAMNRTAGYDYASNGGHNGENGAKRVARLPIAVWATEDAFMLECPLLCPLTSRTSRRPLTMAS